MLQNNSFLKTSIIIFLFSFIFSNGKLPQAFMKDLNNKKVNIYDFIKDGPMLVNFWFLACEPCKKEMKYLDIYNDKYRKYGFKVVSINTDNARTFSRVKPYVNSKKYSFEVLSDPKSLFFRKMGGQQCPYTILFDEKGNIINKHIGYNPGDEIKFEKEIVTLLKKQISSDTTKVDSSIIVILKEAQKDTLIKLKSEKN
tara:strand:+ start:1131 stop:1724 length:594 start_codon:yes stop_codon:yes gene_type:complete